MSLHRHLPPDRDPALRALLALDSATQITQLREMYGDPAPLPTPLRLEPSSPHTAAFLPVGGTRATSPSGGLSWIPTQWPQTVIHRPTSTALAICLHPLALNAHCYRSGPRITKLDTNITTHLHKRGVYTVPFALGPLGWTLDTIDAAIDTAVAFTLSRDSASTDCYVSAHSHASLIGPYIKVEAGDPQDGLAAFMFFGDETRPLLSQWRLRRDFIWEWKKYRHEQLATPAANQHHAVDDNASQDDDSDDLANRVLLTMIRKYIQPEARWDDVGHYVRLMRAGLERHYGPTTGDV